jgi:pyridoxal phosphate enzyme (YggS family)
MTPDDFSTPEDFIRHKLEAVIARIGQAALRAGRSPDAVTLVAVTKSKPDFLVRRALDAGQLVFGENRVQEAVAKFPALRREFPAMRLHLIGALQTNKVDDAVAIADVIESLDRPKLADAIVVSAARAGRLPDLLIQVNTGGEPQKSGVPLAQADPFIARCQARFGEKVVGLMCVPPVDADPRPHFFMLAEMAARHGLRVLSMGMSGDFEIAIAAGATHVRVGSAIFGAR